MSEPTKPLRSRDAAPLVTDTIPRLHRIADHGRDQLIGLASDADSFEDCRERYLQTQQRLDREGRGRVTASRIGDAERNWAPTRDCLQELMRWGALEPARLPSERKFLDRYRDARYVLTPRGDEMAEAARTSRAAFTDAVSACLIEAHPYFRGLLDTLQAGPIVYPTVERGDVKRARAQQRTVVEWAAWGAEQIAGDASVKQTEHELKRALDRFRNRGENKPSDKALAEALSDGFAVAGFLARGAYGDATTIRTFLRWGPELLLYDYSHNVPAHPKALVLWGCSDISMAPGGRLLTNRRGFGAYADRVAREIVTAYGELSATADTEMETPFLAVHLVRAQVAERLGVTRPLVNQVLGKLVDGAFPDVAATVAVFVGSNTSLPVSEPPFRYRGGRRMVMQVNPK